VRLIQTIIILLVFIGFGQMEAQIPFTCRGQFILTLSQNGDSRLALVEVDPLTNSVDFDIVNGSMRIDINAIGYRNQENLIYGIDPNRHILYRVDAVGSVETLTTLPLDSRLSYFAGDISPDGRFLILIGGSSSGLINRDEELVKVDLTLPGYPVERINITGPTTRIYDIAFNPLSGVLYGFDSNNERLVRVDENTAEVFADFPATSNVDNAGSLFFDAFGNLYAYGGPFLSPQNRFYEVSTTDGQFTVLAQGPDAEGTDACSCPYTVEMKKIVNLDWTYPCKEIIYSFIIANGSGLEQREINLIDRLPPGFTFVEVIKNPFGGVVTSTTGDSDINIVNATIPMGIDTVKVRVYVDDIADKRYFNQARLTNLPVSLGQVVLSDEPRTLAEEDSTYVDVRRIPFDVFNEDFQICDGDTIRIDLSDIGEKFVWSDGSTAARRNLTEEDMLTVGIAAGCDSAVINYTITSEDIELMVDKDEFMVRLGDTIMVNSTVFNTGNTVIYRWFDPEGNELKCGECTHFEFVPLNSGTYILQVENEFGCIDEVPIKVVLDKSRRIFVPNVFSPNFDNINDRFFIQSQDYGKIEQLSIFDRWGELIYRGQNFFVNDESGGWDGQFNGQVVMPGVYTWMAEITFLDNETEFFAGDITLIRP